jgi:glycosyltransferase involved in cell wall biosynthesis
VKFAGHVSDPQPLYANADVVLITSDFEGTPNVALEAMAAGVPVVATDAGDLPDLLGRGECGRLRPRGDVEALCSSIRELIQNRASGSELATRASRLVAACHSEAALKTHLIALYGASRQSDRVSDAGMVG